MLKDWTILTDKYKGMWVALDKDEVTVLGFGKKIGDAFTKAQQAGNNNPIMFKVPESNTAYIGQS
jgi:hypothetical protein